MSTPNCMSCPSRLSADEASKFFGITSNVPMCARYGKVLALPHFTGGQERMVGGKIAGACDSYGKVRPVEGPEYPDTLMFMPVPDTMLEDEPTPADLESVGSCRNCVFFVSQKEVATEHNISGGACSRKGIVVFPERTVKEASECEDKLWKEDSYPDYDDASALRLMPMFKEANDYDDSAAGRWRARRKGGVIDPADYESDAEVTPEDRSNGIKAWREVKDPNSDNSVLIPVFDDNYFTELEQFKIPRTGDREHPEDYIDARDYVYSSFVEIIKLDETPALWGQPGVGKTELGRHMAWLMQVPFERLNITKDSEVADIAGETHFKDGETTFIEGRLPTAWRRPGVIMLDEPNAGPHEVWQFLRPLTDNSKQLVLDMSENKTVIDRNPHCFLLMAMNPAWDYRNTGLNELADADTNRLAHIYMELPDRKTEKQILTNACRHDGWEPANSLLEKIMDVSDDIRAMVNDGSLPITWGVRSNLKAIRHLQYFSADVAYRRAVVDFLDPNIAQMVLKVVEMKGLE